MYVYPRSYVCKYINTATLSYTYGAFIHTYAYVHMIVKAMHLLDKILTLTKLTVTLLVHQRHKVSMYLTLAHGFLEKDT